MRSRWPRRARAPSRGARSSSSRRRRSQGHRPSSASTKPVTSALLRAVPALLAPAVAAFRAAALGQRQPETAAYICESCDTAIAEHHKTWMLEHGEWRAMITDGAGKTAGFHLSSLYSPVGWRAWREIAAAWESRRQQRIGIGRRHQDLQEHRAGRNLGRGRRSAGLAASGRAPRGLPRRYGAARRSALGRRGRRAEKIASRRRSGPSGAARSPGWSSTAC